MYCVYKHTSPNAKKGYNIALGGCTIGKHSPETINKIRLHHKGTRGYHFSEAQKQKISASKDSCKKAVICIELDAVYSSASEAARALGLRQANITSCCKGRLHTTGGFHWGYIK